MSLVRVSIANLAWYARMRGNEAKSSFGVLDPKELGQGVRQYGALSGSAMLKPEGKRLLEDTLDATGFEFDEVTDLYDARFHVDEADLELVLKTFSAVDESGANSYFEIDPTLDIKAELFEKKYPGGASILPAHVAPYVQAHFVKVVRQQLPALGADTSSRAGDIPTHRIFRIFELEMPSQVFGAFSCSTFVRFFKQVELATTAGGSKAGRTSDGWSIKNNLFV